MKKLIWTLVLLFSFVTLGFAQHRTGGGSVHRPSTPHISAPRQRGGEHRTVRMPRQNPNNKHYREARSHFDGRRFDREYFYRHFGHGHPFPILYWYGQPFFCGSVFYVDSIPFEMTSCVDGFYGMGTFYILEVDDGYILVSPTYPDVVFAVRIAW
jgi:hypothetical protein